MGLISSLNHFTIWEFSRTIRDGDIVNIILKPFSNILHWFVKLLPSKVTVAIIYLIIISIASYFLKIDILPDTREMFPFILTLLLGIIGSFLLYYCIGLTTIWLKRVYGLYDLIKTLEGVLGGIYIPIFFLPMFLQNISKFLPFRYFSYLPLELSEQSSESSQILIGISIEVIWIVILIVIYKIIWKKGVKDLEIVGI
jgi:ABC-2 type transport system permease protein